LKTVRRIARYEHARIEITYLKIQQNAKGILIMIVSMVAFALADTLVKVTSSVASSAQIMFFLIGGGLILFGLIAKIQGHSLINKDAFAPVLLLRYASEIIGMVGMVIALSKVPLATVGAITQATPLLVVIGAVIFLKEKVSWRRWSAIAFGFLGVLLIVQPGTSDFDLSVLWAILAMVALSVRDLTTRLTPPNMASTSLATFTMIATIPFPILWVLYNGDSFFPTTVNWWLVLLMVALGSSGYMLLITSIRMAEVSVVTPFRYSRILFLLILGIVVFDEKPNALVLAGAALIIASGVYMMWREQQIKKAEARKSR
jgi:drug/metabolite transporter (DMT)-like permease